MAIRKRRTRLSSSRVKGIGARSISGVKIGDINAGMDGHIVCDIVKAGMGCDETITKLGNKTSRPRALKQIKSLMKKAGY